MPTTSLLNLPTVLQEHRSQRTRSSSLTLLMLCVGTQPLGLGHSSLGRSEEACVTATLEVRRDGLTYLLAASFMVPRT